MRVGSNEPPRILTSPSVQLADGVPAWAPSGEWIAYVTNADGDILLDDNHGHNHWFSRIRDLERLLPFVFRITSH